LWAGGNALYDTIKDIRSEAYRTAFNNQRNCDCFENVKVGLMRVLDTSDAVDVDVSFLAKAFEAT